MFICDCVNPAWSTNKLIKIIDYGHEIPAWKFLNEFSDEFTREQLEMMAAYPHDYTFYHNRIEDIYWFTHSSIEHFYQ